MARARPLRPPIPFISDLHDPQSLHEITRIAAEYIPTDGHSTNMSSLPSTTNVDQRLTIYKTTGVVEHTSTFKAAGF